MEEVAASIKELKTNKRPGPDGYSALYYRTFTELLSPILANAFNVLLNDLSFEQESLMAIVCTIPKPLSDATSCAGYRPISLLNLDIKLLAKVLAKHLNQIICNLIHKDQVGFMPHRQAGDNVRRAVLMAHIAKKRCIPSCFLPLDIKRAFNMVSWPYLIYSLQKWGFGPHFIK